MKLVPFILFVLLGGDVLRWKFMLVTSSAIFGCDKYNVKLLSILNQLCNTTQVANIQQRDACYGCFFRVGILPPGPTQLIALSQCATIYLNNSGYQFCAQQLAAVVIGLQPVVEPIFKLPSCSNGYCEFVRCIRRTNANLLINACFVANLVNRDFNRIDQRITFFTNTTACILTRTRCSQYNPITGELQQQISQVYPVGATNSVGSAGYFHHNALQVAPNGDIKILAFPSSIVVGDFFCSSLAGATLEQPPLGCLLT